MKKNKGVITLIVTVLVIAALGFVAIWGIGTERAGSASGIRQGLDLAGGVSITYQVVGEENPSVEDMADTIYKLQSVCRGTARRRRCIRRAMTGLILRFQVCLTQTQS